MGYGSVLLNDAAGTVTVTALSVSGLVNGTLAHIHGPAVPGANAGVVCTIASNATVAPFTGPVSNLPCGTTYTAAQLASMRAGNFYFNVHTIANGGGEIRGQIFFPSTFDPTFIIPVALTKTVAPFSANPANVFTNGAGNVVILRPAMTPIAPTTSTSFVAFGAVTGLNGTQTNAHLHGPASAYVVNLPPTTGSFAYAPLYLTPAQALDLVNNRRGAPPNEPVMRTRALASQLKRTPFPG